MVSKYMHGILCLACFLLHFAQKSTMSSIHDRGRPGGRPVRSKIDGAIKEQLKLGTDNLTAEGVALFPDKEKPLAERQRMMWDLPDNEKRTWLKAILAARTVQGKSWSDYRIPPSDDGDGEQGDISGEGDQGNGVGDISSIENTKQEESTEDKVKAVTKKRGSKKIDLAIKEQIKLGTDNLTAEGMALFPDENRPISERLRKMYKLPDNEKRVWLKAVLGARTVQGKEWSDYMIPASSDENSQGEIHAIEEELNKTDNQRKMNRESRSAVAAMSDFDNTHAIFLISFGEEASESTLVERCVLSLRRRGAWTGYIVVLTDASPERYEGEWDDNVIVMHPLEEHLKLENGMALEFTEDNTSLKSKRFKTFVTEYMDLDARLDPVELIYYLDIDIMAGDSVMDMFGAIEGKYAVSRDARSDDASRLYFFTPLSKEWPLQGGTYIVERRNSQHCLELWRREIDAMTVSGRGRDQDALRTVYRRIESGEESRCQLVRMDNENHISFPTPRTFDKLARSTSDDYPSLVHISNTVFAKWIDEKKQNKFIHELLELTDEEKPKYGKSVVKAKKSDM